MKFRHDGTGLIFDLLPIAGTDFWSDRDGDLYLATDGTCESVRPKKALESILLRGKPNCQMCPLCGKKTLMAKPHELRIADWIKSSENYRED